MSSPTFTHWAYRHDGRLYNLATRDGKQNVHRMMRLRGYQWVAGPCPSEQKLRETLARAEREVAR